MAISLYLGKHFILLYLMLLIGAAVLAFFSYRRLRGEITTAWRSLFVGLRTLLFFLIFSALFSLVAQLRLTREEKPLVAVLLDCSHSMEQVSDGVSRSAVAKRYLHRTLLPYLGNRAEIAFFLFSDNIYERGDTAMVKGAATMIGTALEAATTAPPRVPSAVFLLSDGRNTSGRDPLEVAERCPFPIHTVKIGHIAAANNISISGLRVNPIVYRGDTVPVSVILSNSGPERRGVTIELSGDGTATSRKKLPSLEDGIELPVELSFVPEHAGIQDYEVEVGPFEDETNQEDNRRSFTVRVLEKRKKVALISYQLNWDYRFLRAFLKTQKDIEPSCFARVANDLFLIQLGKDTHRGAIREDAVLSADIVILINPEGIQERFYNDIVKRVAGNSAGLLIMGNRLPAFSSFKETYPLILAGGTRSGDAIAVPARDGSSGALFGSKETAPPYPPLSDPLQVRMVKAGATVHLEARSESGERSLPLLSSIRYRQGSIAALSAENLWHWKTLSLATGANPLLYDEVMNNILKWLMPRRETERFVLYADRTKLLWGEPMTVSAALYDEMMKPLEGGTIVLRIERDGDTVAEYVLKDVGTGNYEREVGVLEPGTYTARARARFPESIRTTPSFSFVVEEQEIERLNTEPDHLLLRNIADASAGKCLQITDALTGIHLRSSPVSVKKGFHFGRGFLPLLLIAALFFSELLLRKMKGLR